MDERSGRPEALHWALLQAGLLVGAACLLLAFAALPAIALRAGWLALGAGGLAALAVLRWPLGQPEAPGAAGLSRRHALALVAALAVGWALRAWAATESVVPLGYDYGFYKATFDAYSTGDLPLAEQPAWMASQFEPGLPALHAVLHGVSGLGAEAHLRYLFPALAAALGLVVFAAARAYAGPRAGLVAAALAGLSALQLEAHAYLYEKQILALLLLVAALTLLRRHAWIAAGVLLGAVGVWHRPTLLLAAIGLPIAVLADPDLRPKWRGWGLTAVLSLALFLPVWLLLPETFVTVGNAVAEQSGRAFTESGGTSSGTFFELGEGLRLMAPYLPLALAAALAAWRWPQWRVPALLSVAAIAYVALQLPLNRRFLVAGDVLAIVVAGAALRPLAGPRAVAVAVASLVLAAGLAVATVAQPPVPHRFLEPEQWRELPSLRDLPPEAVLVADNLRSPYVLAEGGHRTYGPGLFEDPHTRSDWRRFWAGLSGDELHGFVSAYGDDVYFVQADDAGPDWGSASLREPEFTLLRDEGGLRVWHYNG